MTDLLAWLNPTRWLIILGAAASLILGYGLWTKHQQDIGEARSNARWETATEQLKADARTKLADETAKVRAAETALQDFKNQQELKDANNQKTVSDLAGRLRAAAGPAGRLRDPNATAGCGGGSGGATSQTAATIGDRADDAAQAGGLFSEGATELLQRLTREADDINVAYASCRADAFAVRAGAYLGD